MPETHLYQGAYAQSLIAKGRAEGVANAVVRVLASRGIVLSGTDRERIENCCDVELLKVWLIRAISVDSAEELFA
ncbi:hypothetical protein [Nonomuraea aurantiaca]|uniref:hypothetical protein n=1 Tax=Nonomuraea aurantiaca TaxID=2878562 RepID=UPI001CDA4ECD|nr:hypothetical protein [Nonomuraea aurantiaca]MCA2221443.1 hypothetical protein [Nonomuraea aurantiaca]